MKKVRAPKLYDLPVEFTGGGSYHKTDDEANLKIKVALENISDFKERLIYFNDNVRSLSTYKMQPEIHFQWGYSDQEIKIYCGCLDCRKKPYFSVEHEKIYLKLRDREVKRLVQDIEMISTYKGKLEYLFKTKGYEYLKLFTVYANVPYTPSVDLNKEMFFFMPVIDLTPVEHEEIVIYNGLVMVAFDKEYRDGTKFSNKYDCFDYEKESLRLNNTLNKSIAPMQLLEYCKAEIENYFHYENGQLSTSKIVTRQSKIEDAIFTKMIFGVDIDLNESKLNSHILFRYYHISEVVKFYRSLLLRIKSQNNPKEVDMLQRNKQAEKIIEFNIPDKMEKEINIILTIFKSQYKKYDKTDMFSYISDSEGKSGIDGRYMHSIEIVSHVELMSFQTYKKHFTERFENTNNSSLVKSQLLSIKAKALEARDFYNENLTGKDGIVKEFEDKRKESNSKASKLGFEEWQKIIDHHNAVVTISGHYSIEIYLGCDRLKCKGRTDGEFWYHTYNYQLAEYCQRVVEFIDLFDCEENSSIELSKAEFQNSFFHFDCYFNEHRKVMMNRTDNLYKFKEANAQYFQATNLVENDIEEITKKFKNEIRNKVVELETDKKIKLYLEQIQSELNSIYEYLENKPVNPELEFLNYHHSVPSIQNLIREIARTNNIVFTGTLTAQNPNINIEQILSETDKEERVSDLKQSIQMHLQPYKSIFNNESDYLKAIELINAFFLAQPFKAKSPLFVKNGYVKKLAFVLGEIWRSQRNQVITYEYLQFYKQGFTIFEKHVIDKKNIFGNNLYKYSISIT